MSKRKGVSTDHKNGFIFPNSGLYIKIVAKIVSECWFTLTRLIHNNFEKLSGFKVSDVSNFEKFTQILYRPTDPASLGVARALFGLCMVIDIVEERGLANIDKKWGNPWDCHFPLIHGMKPPSLPWMIMIYAIMWIGAFGITLGLYFKIACACFVLPYWYIFLLDKSYWNNHTYLYGIVAILFWGTEANKYLALDRRRTKQTDSFVPYWNYFILKFQFFVLYFLAGLKKSSKEWLEGYSMTNLSQHWVFSPFTIFLTNEQTDFLIIHWFVFIFDLSIGFWMLFEKTRIPAMIFCILFHLMNSRLFNIGMFPYVCLVTMPLFCRADWPRKLGCYFSCKQKLISDDVNFIDANIERKEELEINHKEIKEFLKSNCCSTSSSNKVLSNKIIYEEAKTRKRRINGKCLTNRRYKEHQKNDNNPQIPESSTKLNEKDMITTDRKIRILQQSSKVTKKQKFVVSLLLCHVVLQFFLPYSHFISKGYNNWVPGLYGYSWDMMVHAWDTILVVVKMHDNANKEVGYLNPEAWVQGDRWTKHSDMAMQYSHCLKDNLMREKEKILNTNQQSNNKEKWTKLSGNLSIYIDVWCSLNGRFQQRMFNSSIDMLTVDWHPFKPVSFLMPLLTEYNSYRYKMDEIQQQVYSWSNETEVLFVADFPGMHLQNYISTDLTNVSLTVLEGEVTYSEDKSPNTTILLKERSIAVKTGIFHKVEITSSFPACYMYTYTNQTMQKLLKERIPPEIIKDMMPLLKQIRHKVIAWTKAFTHIANAFFHLVYDVPMVQQAHY